MLYLTSLVLIYLVTVKIVSFDCLHPVPFLTTPTNHKYLFFWACFLVLGYFVLFYFVLFCLKYNWPITICWTFVVAQMVKIQSLDWEDPLEEEMATHSSILAWKIPWTVEPGWLQSMGSQRVRHNWAHTTLKKNALRDNDSLKIPVLEKKLGRFENICK